MKLYQIQIFVMVFVHSTLCKEISTLESCPLSGQPTQACKVVVALVACEGERIPGHLGTDLVFKGSRQEDQLATLIKSIVYTKSRQGINYSPDFVNLEFLIFSNKQDIFENLRRKISTWNKTYTENMELQYHDIRYPAGSECVSAMFRPCASFRIFLPQALPKTQALIYLDTDIIFFRNILYLWQEFNKYTDETIISSPKEWLFYRKFKSQKVPVFNSGMMLMNLSRIREISNWNSVFFNLCDKNRKYFPGPQAMLSLYFIQKPESHVTLNCTWHPMNFYEPRFTTRACNLHKYGISALHGFQGLFHMSDKFKIFYNAFRGANMTTYDGKDKSIFKSIINEIKSSRLYCDTVSNCSYVKRAVSKLMK